MNILEIIADNLSNKILVEKNVRDFDICLPEIVQRGLKKDEWFELYRILGSCGECRKIIAKNLDKFDFSEFFFGLRFHIIDKYRDFFVKAFLDSKNFAEIRKFLELDLEEVRKWDDSARSSELKRTKHYFFERMIIYLTKNDLKDRKLRKFLISYIENNNDLKVHLYENYHDRLEEIGLIRKTMKQRMENIERKMTQYKLEISLVLSVSFVVFLISLVLGLESFVLALGVFGSVASILSLVLRFCSHPKSETSI